MRLGLISDTHMPSSGWSLSPRILEIFSDVDLIIHAGDIFAPWVLDWLEQSAPVVAVSGSASDAFGNDPRVKRTQVLEIEGHHLGVIHNMPLPPFYSMTQIFGTPVDIVVCGDTHIDAIESHDGILFVNPGSATLPGSSHRMDRPGTVGLLDIIDGQVEARIISLA